MASEDSMLSDDDYVNSLNGFLLVLSSEHDVLYVSDNVKDYLGLSKASNIVPAEIEVLFSHFANG